MFGQVGKDEICVLEFPNRNCKDHYYILIFSAWPEEDGRNGFQATTVKHWLNLPYSRPNSKQFKSWAPKFAYWLFRTTYFPARRMEKGLSGDSYIYIGKNLLSLAKMKFMIAESSRFNQRSRTFWQPGMLPTKHFTILEPRNPSIVIFEWHKFVDGRVLLFLNGEMICQVVRNHYFRGRGDQIMLYGLRSEHRPLKKIIHHSYSNKRALKSVGKNWE